MREREEASITALSYLQEDFLMILSEIEKAQGEKTPYSTPIKTHPLETTIRTADEGSVHDTTFEWLGKDRVFRNVQLIITSLPESLPEAWIQIHAWQDDEINKIRHWQTKEVERRNLTEFRADRKTMLTTLERAYTTVSGWTRADLTLTGALQPLPQV